MHYSKDHLKRFAYPPHRNIFWAELFVLRIWSNVSEITRVQDYITEKAMIVSWSKCLHSLITVLKAEIQHF